MKLMSPEAARAFSQAKRFPNRLNRAQKAKMFIKTDKYATSLIINTTSMSFPPFFQIPLVPPICHIVQATTNTLWFLV